MDSQTRSGAQDLLAVALNDQSSDALSALNTFTQTQFDGLRDVLPELPTAAQPRATQSLSLLAVVAGRSAAIHRETAGGGATAIPGAGQSPASSSPAPGGTTSPSPSRTGAGSPGPDETPNEPSLPSVPTSAPTDAPTIPPLPVPTSLPTSLPLPSSLPTLPDLGSLLPNQP
jgi:hypothetical protein